MNLALLAGLAMCVNDIFAVCMVQAEARNHGLLAGIFDSLMWLTGIITTTISVTALQGHSLHQKVLVIAMVTAANIIGSVIGVAVGKRFIKEAD